MTASRRHFLGLAGTGLAGLTVAARTFASTQGTDCALMALGKPSATGPGKKYDAQGKARLFPGHTIVCHLNQPGPTFTALTEIVAQLRTQVGTRNITWTPPASYHMTVFDGVTNEGRRPGDWPHMLPLDASLEECNRYVGERLRKFDLGLDLPIRMVPDESQAVYTNTQFPLRPIDAAENKRLRDLRDRLVQATGIRHASHDSYGFHSTFGYYIRQFDTLAEERRYQALWLEAIRELRRRVPVIELGAPEFCLFDSMDEFRTQFLLRRQ